MKCLVTGCEGFLGSHLAEFLLGRGMAVSGIAYADTGNLAAVADKLDLHHGDLRNGERVAAIVDRVKPDIVFHIGAQSYVTVSWANPRETLETNVMGSFYLLDSVHRFTPAATIVDVSSSAVYGPREEHELPLREDSALRPISIYGISKAAAEMIGEHFFRVHSMKVILVRPFNMTGPRKVGDACSDFARGIVEIEMGEREELDVGNLESRRDITDGRDAAVALWLVASRGVPGEVYNLCAGEDRSMRSVLETLIRFSGREIRHKISPQRLRSFDEPVYRGDGSKLQSLGWRPKITMERTLADLLDYWRQAISGPAHQWSKSPRRA